MTEDSLPVADQKKTLRRLIRAQAQLMTQAERERSDRALWERLRVWPPYREAQCLFVFFGEDWEPGTVRILEDAWARGVRVGLPRCGGSQRMDILQVFSRDDLELSRAGVYQPKADRPPISAAEVALTLVPAMAFDRNGFRLGRGGGYYDRFLRDYEGRSLGLCREAFLLERLPVEAHDHRVGAVMTEERTLSIDPPDRP